MRICLVTPFAWSQPHDVNDHVAGVADALPVATFSSPNRLGYPPARSAREKLLGRIDALIALSEEVRDAAEERFPGDYRLLSPGVDTTLFAPAAKQRRIVLELRPNE